MISKNIVFSFLCVVLFSACTSSNFIVNNKNLLEKNASKNTYINTNNKLEKTFLENAINHNTKSTLKVNSSIHANQALMDFYKEWKNVKYKYGGNSKKGIDCSAFTQRVFKEKFNLKIPRTTITQVKVGKYIKKSELKIGDLVFFKTGIRDRHVGIYMGNGNFMHASIKGVKFTKLNKPYYKKNYWTSRRVFN